MAHQKHVAEYFEHTGGENKQFSKLEMPPTDALSCENIIFGDPGSIERGYGYVKVNTSPIQIESGDAECTAMVDYRRAVSNALLVYAGKKNATPTYQLIGEIASGTFTARTPTSGENVIGTTQRPRFAILHDALLATTYTKPIMYWNGGTGGGNNFRRLGLPPVSETITAAVVAGAGVPDGVYRFRITYYVSDWTGFDHEGRVSDAMLNDADLIIATAGAGSNILRISFAAIPSSITDRYTVTGRAIYMTRTDGTNFFYHSSTTNLGAHTVDITTQPSETEALAPVVNYLPPGAKIIIPYQGRLIAFNLALASQATGDTTGTAYPTGMMWSALDGEYSGEYTNGMQAWPPTNFRNIAAQSGEPITGAFILGGDLFCTTKRTIFRIFPSGDGYDYEEVNSATGAMTHEVCKNTENLPILISERSAYFFNGRIVEPIGSKEENAWKDDLVLSRLTEAVGAYERHPDVNRYWLLATSSANVGVGKHDIMLGYDFRLKAWMRRTEIEMSYIVTVEQSTGEDDFYSADYKGFVYHWKEGIYNYGAGAQSNSILRGTVTSWTSGTLTCAGKTWVSNEFKAVPVYIVSGTGMGQRRVITSNTSTQLSVTPNWDKDPDLSSVFNIGAYKAVYRHFWDALGNKLMPKRIRSITPMFDGQPNMDFLQVRMRYNFDLGDGDLHNFNMQTSGAVFDTAVFDEAVFGGSPEIFQLLCDLFQTTQIHNVQFELTATNAPFKLYGYSMEYQLLPRKRGVLHAL